MDYKYITHGKERFIFFTVLIMLFFIGIADSFPGVEKHFIFYLLPLSYVALGYYLKTYEPDRFWFYLWVVCLVLTFSFLSAIQYPAFFIFALPLGSYLLWRLKLVKPVTDVQLWNAKDSSLETNDEWRKSLAAILDNAPIRSNYYRSNTLYQKKFYKRDVDYIMEHYPPATDSHIYACIVSWQYDAAWDWVDKDDERYQYFIQGIAFGEFGMSWAKDLRTKTYTIYRWADITDKSLRLEYTGDYDNYGREDSYDSNFALYSGDELLHPPPHDVYKKMKEKKNEVMEEDLYKLLQIVYAAYKENVSNHVPIKDRKWLVYLHKALTPHNSSHFYVDAVKRIPDYILSNALRHYPMPQTDRIFAVIDTSLFRAARIGVAISMQGISWNNALFGARKSIQSNFFLSWEELSQKKLTIKKWKLVIDEKHSIDLGLVSYYLKPAELLELLNKLIEGYKEIHQEE